MAKINCDNLQQRCFLSIHTGLYRSGHSHHNNGGIITAQNHHKTAMVSVQNAFQGFASMAIMVAEWQMVEKTWMTNL